MTYLHKNFRFIRFNRDYYDIPKELKLQAISVADDIYEIIDLICKV